ncbi:sulfite exporter TauE/SafE family protein [Helicobacter sp. 11S02596-1]|uniref:sulfite exporter TauE/SafE family protein n=1 Tax=Helicobacter sp. 11S02596-1 TaxID=1476194 RepID=UPI000BA7A6C0|nr:sulfite exporter TauE/SafE family protein [Helicobacter sp. 11S02596-1]PAF41520.1 hypothetical protein BJI48_08345 [Helicobacter sp. 11S02596-1]
MMEKLDLFSIFVLGLSMSLSHCIGMCGGIVIAYSNGKIHPDSNNFYQTFCHILYNLGRITSYMIIGGISAAIGYGISASMSTKGILFIVVGILLVLFAFLYMFFPKAIAYFEPSIGAKSQSKISMYFQRSFGWLMTSKSPWSFYGLGILNGFLPCGMVYWFALSAALAPSIWMGMVTMGTFGIATFLPMFVLGFISGKMLTTSYRSFFMKLSFVLMLCFGGYSIYKGVLMLEGKKTHQMGHHMGSHQMNHHNNTPEHMEQGNHAEHPKEMPEETPRKEPSKE